MSWCERGESWRLKGVQIVSVNFTRQRHDSSYLCIVYNCYSSTSRSSIFIWITASKSLMTPAGNCVFVVVVLGNQFYVCWMDTLWTRWFFCTFYLTKKKKLIKFYIRIFVSNLFFENMKIFRFLTRTCPDHGLSTAYLCLLKKNWFIRFSFTRNSSLND